MLDNRAIQKVLREIYNQDLAKALKLVDSAVATKIFGNISKLAAAIIKEDQEYMGPVRLKDVVDSQINILSKIYELKFYQEITIPEDFRFPDEFETIHHFGYFRNRMSTISSDHKLTTPPEKGLNDKKFIEAFYDIFVHALDFSQKAQKNGIFALEDIIDSEKVGKRDIFEYGIQLVIDRIDRKLIDKILSNIVKQEKDEHLHRLKTIQQEAVLMIHDDYNPWLFVLMLISYTDISMDDPRLREIWFS
jgi:hypothetical protein